MVFLLNLQKKDLWLPINLVDLFSWISRVTLQVDASTCNVLVDTGLSFGSFTWFCFVGWYVGVYVGVDVDADVDVDGIVNVLLASIIGEISASLLEIPVASLKTPLEIY